MMAMLWYPDRRRRLEQPLLDRYHAALDGERRCRLRPPVARRRLSAVGAVADHAAHLAGNGGIAARVWWNNLERIFLAVDDLGCAELLD